MGGIDGEALDLEHVGGRLERQGRTQVHVADDRPAVDELGDEDVLRLATAAAKEDVAAFKSQSTQQDDVVRRARRLSQAYGFKECGSTKSDAVRAQSSDA